MKRASRALRYFLLLLIVLAFLYSFDASKKADLVVINNTGNTGEMLHDLRERGYINNNVSFWAAWLMLKGKVIEPGVYALNKRMGALALSAALDDPDYRSVTIQEGLRREEVAEVLAKALDWTPERKAEFLYTLPLCPLTGGEGFFFPGTYVIHKDETPEVIKEEMKEKLLSAVGEILNDPDQEQNVLNVSQVLTIASLIQREAGGKSDMRLISGIIWNRLFTETPLQIDATLQYVKGNEERWWPTVASEDKYLASPYNTYEHKGLPPGPIANPGKAAIHAALNPSDTNCMFYLHDNKRNIHCATTYDGHKRNISYYLR